MAQYRCKICGEVVDGSILAKSNHIYAYHKELLRKMRMPQLRLLYFEAIIPKSASPELRNATASKPIKPLPTKTLGKNKGKQVVKKKTRQKVKKEAPLSARVLLVKGNKKPKFQQSKKNAALYEPYKKNVDNYTHEYYNKVSVGYKPKTGNIYEDMDYDLIDT